MAIATSVLYACLTFLRIDTESARHSHVVDAMWPPTLSECMFCHLVFLDFCPFQVAASCKGSPSTTICRHVQAHEVRGKMLFQALFSRKTANDTSFLCPPFRFQRYRRQCRGKLPNHRQCLRPAASLANQRLRPAASLANQQ